MLLCGPNSPERGASTQAIIPDRALNNIRCTPVEMESAGRALRIPLPKASASVDATYSGGADHPWEREWHGDSVPFTPEIRNLPCQPSKNYTTAMDPCSTAWPHAWQMARAPKKRSAMPFSNSGAHRPSGPRSIPLRKCCKSSLQKFGTDANWAAIQRTSSGV